MPDPTQFPQHSLGAVEREAHLAISQLLMTIAKNNLRLDMLDEEVAHLHEIIHRQNHHPPTPTYTAKTRLPKPTTQETPE